MPPKPTCKVVKREGQRGARIDPKGCKVRTSVNAQGSKTKEDKQGQEKIKRTTRSGKMQLAVAGNRQRHFINNWNDKPAAVRSQYKQNHHILYDTGANMTTMTPNTLRHIGYNPDRQSNVSSTNVSDASGNVTQRKILNNVVFYVLLKSDKNREGNRTRQWISLNDNVVVVPNNAPNLLGTTAIRQLKNRFKVKFK
jgi:hypothetical protein